MGYVSENSAFEKGTMALIKSISSSEISLVGGGETVQILEKSGYFDKISFVSSGGGAFLDYLAGKELPGLKALGYYG